MIVVCIKEPNGSLTVGKQYEVISTRASYTDWDIVADDQYVILNDYDINYPYCMSYFISLEDFRNKQIENILT
jgi:hypothetical protein